MQRATVRQRGNRGSHLDWPGRAKGACSGLDMGGSNLERPADPSDWRRVGVGMALFPTKTLWCKGDSFNQKIQRDILPVKLGEKPSPQ